MVYHQTPKKLWGHIVIGMDNAVAGTDNGFSIGEYNCRVMLQQLVDGLTHNLNVTLNGTLTEDVGLKVGKQLLALKERLYLFAGILHIK